MKYKYIFTINKIKEKDGNKTASLFGNRSAAYLMLHNIDEAIKDCLQV